MLFFYIYAYQGVLDQLESVQRDLRFVARYALSFKGIAEGLDQKRINESIEKVFDPKPVALPRGRRGNVFDEIGKSLKEIERLALGYKTRALGKKPGLLNDLQDQAALDILSFEELQARKRIADEALLSESKRKEKGALVKQLQADDKKAFDAVRDLFRKNNTKELFEANRQVIDNGIADFAKRGSRVENFVRQLDTLYRQYYNVFNLGVSDEQVGAVEGKIAALEAQYKAVQDRVRTFGEKFDNDLKKLSKGQRYALQKWASDQKKCPEFSEENLRSLFTSVTTRMASSAAVDSDSATFEALQARILAAARVIKDIGKTNFKEEVKKLIYGFSVQQLIRLCQSAFEKGKASLYWKLVSEAAEEVLINSKFPAIARARLEQVHDNGSGVPKCVLISGEDLKFSLDVLLIKDFGTGGINNCLLAAISGSDPTIPEELIKCAQEEELPPGFLGEITLDQFMQLLEIPSFRDKVLDNLNPFLDDIYTKLNSKNPVCIERLREDLELSSIRNWIINNIKKKEFWDKVLRLKIDLTSQLKGLDKIDEDKKPQEIADFYRAYSNPAFKMIGFLLTQKEFLNDIKSELPTLRYSIVQEKVLHFAMVDKDLIRFIFENYKNQALGLLSEYNFRVSVDGGGDVTKITVGNLDAVRAALFNLMIKNEAKEYRMQTAKSPGISTVKKDEASEVSVLDIMKSMVYDVAGENKYQEICKKLGKKGEKFDQNDLRLLLLYLWVTHTELDTDFAIFITLFSSGPPVVFCTSTVGSSVLTMQGYYVPAVSKKPSLFVYHSGNHYQALLPSGVPPLKIADYTGEGVTLGLA